MCPFQKCKCVGNSEEGGRRRWGEDVMVLRILFFPSFKTSHTTLLAFLGDTQGARFYDMHGTTLHLVILFSVQYMEKRFALILGRMNNV